MYREVEKPFRQNISDEILIIVNRLIKDPKPGRMFDLSGEPTRDELQFLVNNYNEEVSLTHFTFLKSWVLTEGKKGGREAFRPDVDDVGLVDVLAHNHPNLPEVLTTRPSSQDVLNVIPEWKEIVFDIRGMILYSGPRFHPITGLPWKMEDRDKLTQNDLYFLIRQAEKISTDPEPVIVAKMKPDIVFKTWKEVPRKNPLSNFKLS
jgi:hypothetical protein